MAGLKQMIPTAYTNVFAPPWNDYGEYCANLRRAGYPPRSKN